MGLHGYVVSFCWTKGIYYFHRVLSRRTVDDSGDSTFLHACQFLCKEYSVSGTVMGYKVASITNKKMLAQEKQIPCACRYTYALNV
jgi:hypothetical protein